MDMYSEKSDFFNSPIFVLGLPRSGTSMIAGCLGICGAWTGSTVPGGGKENPKGFFEHVYIREKIIKAVLRQAGCDPLGVSKLPPLDLNIQVPGLAELVGKVIRSDEYQDDRPWLYKDAKLTLLWPTFANTFPQARWVIVRRDEDSIIDSCLRTFFMNQHSTERTFWEDFVQEYVIRLNQLKNSGVTCYEIESRDVINGEFSTLRKLVQDLELTYREEELVSFVTPAFWHGATGKSPGTSQVTPQNHPNHAPHAESHPATLPALFDDKA